MKYVAIAGGLGNQMFVYAFCLGLRSKGEKIVLFVPRIKDSNGYGHQGYELEKIFVIQRFDGWKSKIQSSSLKLYSNLIRLFPTKWKSLLFRCVGVHIVKVPENFVFYPEVFDFKNKHELFMGTWQSEKFFKDAESKLRLSFVFNQSLLSFRTTEISSVIQSHNSISIHIRRGDYLSKQYSNGFAGVCTAEYYTNAINYIVEKIESPHYYVFTDDQEWVREYFKINIATYIDFNVDRDSWQDMYLMSQCKHNIIANSSFSWWGAWLNDNPDKIVIAPKLWWRMFETDDVVPETWVRI